LKEAMSRNMEADYFYIADLGSLPYGSKTPEQVQGRCLSLANCFKDLDCDALVVACNTATALGIDSLRKMFHFPIIGVEPYLNYINKVNKDSFKKGELAALVTPNTFESQRLRELKQKRDPLNTIDVIPMPGLALAIEELIEGKDWSLFEEQSEDLFSGIGQNIKTLLLGCTHYPLVAEFVRKKLNVETVCPTKEVIDHLIRVLGDKALFTESEDRERKFFHYASSENGPWFEREISDFIFWS